MMRMTEQINCLECKHHYKEWYYDGLEPIAMKDCICKKNHYPTSYHTPFKELKDFQCDDFERKLYWKILRFLHLNEEVDYSVWEEKGDLE